MDNSSSNSKLVRWDVPFVDWDGISTWVITEEGFDNFTVIVAPLSQKHPADNYPKYLIRFEKILTLLTYEEACAFDRGYLSLPGWTKGMRAYQWIDSPWMDAYRGFFEIRGKKLHHYLIFGDDSFVEVISVGEAHIEKVESKRFIEAKHAV